MAPNVLVGQAVLLCRIHYSSFPTRHPTDARMHCAIAISWSATTTIQHDPKQYPGAGSIITSTWTHSLIISTGERDVYTGGRVSGIWDSGFAYYITHRRRTTDIQMNRQKDRTCPTEGPLTVRVGISDFVLLEDSSGESSTDAAYRRPLTWPGRPRWPGTRCWWPHTPHRPHGAHSHRLRLALGCCVKSREWGSM